MKRIFLLLGIIFLFVQPVRALDIQAPAAPQSAQEYMPSDSDCFSEDLWYILKKAFAAVQPSISEAAVICLSMVAVVLLASLTENCSCHAKNVIDLVGALAMAGLLIKPANTLIQLGVSTVTELTQYGKLLLPVMTAALAAQGGITSSGALYAGTAFFSAVLSSLITNVAIPLLYVYLCLSVANCAIGEKILKGLRNLAKWLLTWLMKLTLYVFTGYMAVSGVVSGTTDASAVKATKLAISGVVPVVGSIISDASEAILVSAATMKNAAGVYGILTIIAICIGPFLRIGTQYLLLKITSAVCGVFGTKKTVELLKDFSGGMGLVLAMTGTACLLQLISTVCFMKGVS